MKSSFIAILAFCVCAFAANAPFSNLLQVKSELDKNGMISGIGTGENEDIEIAKELSGYFARYDIARTMAGIVYAKEQNLDFKKRTEYAFKNLERIYWISMSKKEIFENKGETHKVYRVYAAPRNLPINQLEAEDYLDPKGFVKGLSIEAAREAACYYGKKEAALKSNINLDKILFDLELKIHEQLEKDNTAAYLIYMAKRNTYLLGYQYIREDIECNSTNNCKAHRTYRMYDSEKLKKTYIKEVKQSIDNWQDFKSLILKIWDEE